MYRSYLNVGVDIAALVLFVSLASTGLLLAFELPAGSGADAVWGFTRHEWGDIHFWMAMSMLSVITVHLYLHWKWILAKLKPLGHGKFSRRRVAVTAISLTTLLALAIAPHLAEVTQAPRGYQHRRGRIGSVEPPVYEGRMFSPAYMNGR